jgi:hypothetical protein
LRFDRFFVLLVSFYCSKQRALRLRAYFCFRFRGFSFGLDYFDVCRSFGCSFNYGFGSHFCSRLFSYRCSSFNLYGSSWSFGSFAGQALGFALAAAHFAWVVRRATAAADCDCRCSRCSFSHCNFGNWLGSGNYSWCFDNFGDWCRCFYSGRCCCSFAGFGGLHRRCAGLDNRSACCFGNSGFNNGLRCFSCSDFTWLLLFDGYRCGFGCCLGRFDRVSDNSGGDSCYNYCVAGIGWCFCAFFAAFNRIAIGIVLALTTIAATTLAAGAATWAFTAFTAFLGFVLLRVFAIQQFFFARCCGLFSARLALFTRWARLTGFALRAFATGFVASVVGGDGIQRLAQFTRLAFFAGFAITRLTLFTRRA